MTRLRSCHLYINVIILPRQARDKHRENSKKPVVLGAPPPPAGTVRDATGSHACQVAQVREGQQGESLSRPLQHYD